MKTLKQYCIFNHPHEQPCQIEVNDIKEWLTQKPVYWRESPKKEQTQAPFYLKEELLEELRDG